MGITEYPSMALDEILLLPSADAAYDSEYTVADILPHMQREINANFVSSSKDMSYSDIRENMRRNGQTVPICIADDYEGFPMVYNGHHRIALAVELGWTEMYYTDDFMESDGELRTQ
jgi:hypothetical protein